MWWLLMVLAWIAFGVALVALTAKGIMWFRQGRAWPYRSGRTPVFAIAAAVSFVLVFVFAGLALARAPFPQFSAPVGTLAQSRAAAQLPEFTLGNEAPAPSEQMPQVGDSAIAQSNPTSTPAVHVQPTAPVTTAQSASTVIMQTWENTKFQEWTALMAEMARVNEWSKLKGPAVPLVETSEVGQNDAPAVTPYSIWGIFTGHGDFEYGTVRFGWQYRRGTLYVALFENQTEEPLQFRARNIPVGGTSAVEYNSYEHVNIEALAGLPLLDGRNFHCGIRCDSVVVTHIVHTNNGDVRQDYEFNLTGMVNKPAATGPASMVVTSSQPTAVSTPAVDSSNLEESPAEICGEAFIQDWRSSSPKFPVRDGYQLWITTDPASVDGKQKSATRLVILSDLSLNLSEVAIGDQGHANSFGCLVKGQITKEKIDQLMQSMPGAVLLDLRAKG